MSQNDDSVYFPDDVREDVALFANITLFRAAVYIVMPLFIGVIFFLFLPFSIGIRLASLFFFPAAGLVTVLADIPGRIRRYKRYLKEPSRRKSGSPSEEVSIQKMVGVGFFSGPYVHYKDGSAAVFLRAEPPPWEQLTYGQKIYIEEIFVTAARRAFSSGLEVNIYADVDRDLCREEWDRRESQYNGMEDDGLKELGLSRLRYHREFTQAKKTEYHIRLRAVPGMVEMSGRPGSSEERRRMMEEVLQDAAGGMIMELNRASITVSALGSEAIRNLTAKQFNPVAWRRVLPPVETDWTIPGLYWDEDDTNPEQEKVKNEGLIKRLLNRNAKNKQLQSGIPESDLDVIMPVPKPQNRNKFSLAGMFKALFQRFKRKSKPTGAYDPLPNVITVWSPVPAGKTFTAVNLAVSLAWRGHNVILVDLDLRKPAVHNWFKIYNTGGLKEMLASPKRNPWTVGFTPKEVPGLLVLSGTGNEPILSSENTIVDMLGNLSRQVGYIVVDAGSSDDISTNIALGVANRVLLVADQDPYRLENIAMVLDTKEAELDMNKVYVVANKVVESPHLRIEDIRAKLELKVDYQVPERTTEVLEGMSSKIPPSLYSQEISSSFREIALDMAS
ncbi:AAA family ATPase [Desulforamulus aquiferis]|uniref:Division plane positioning ATPase MipZ n=1 Tax=Desulforamulus aquiferis TaxID=1397668 RepID=A0AAW7Z8J0_9FIRM|nr:division plane positioning ATPase MipZ [Desulforamulus aquiferis]MDO7785791.1 division plane positioning ATPase MipZ [Desulforamulus aquiferis]